MRPGQNRRMRGRARSKGPNPLTRSYESNGPDVKIRGTAQHVADKYAQLARDAQASGDPISAENYFQHAEHYYRMIAAAQEQYRQQYGLPQKSFDDEGAEDGDEDSGLGYGDFPPNGQSQNGVQARGFNPADEFGEYGPDPRQGGGERNGQPVRYDRQNRQNRFDRNDRYDRNDRGGQDFRGNQDRGERYDRQQQPDRQQHPDRQGGGYDRQQQNGERYDRRERYGRDAGGTSTKDSRSDRDGRTERAGRPERDGRPDRDMRQDHPAANARNEARYSPPAPQDEDAEPMAGGLPAFLTAAPVRIAPPAPEPDLEAETAASAPVADVDAEVVRPRRRRTRKVSSDVGVKETGLPDDAGTAAE